MRFKQTNPQPVRKKYRLYSPTALTNAYRFVKEEGGSVLKASKLFQVPENTLRDRVLGKIDPETVTMGSGPLFSELEEARIVDHLKTMAKYGYGYTVQETLNLATDFAVHLGKRTQQKPLSYKWIRGLYKRWPDIKCFTPRALEYARAKMTKQSVVQKYFEDLRQCLKEHKLTDKPHLIYNVDEKGLTINLRPPRVIASADSCPPAVTSGKGQTITILGCGSASGSSVPPYFVFPGKRMNPDLLDGASPGASATVSETGWSNSEVFRTYLQDHFLKYVPGHKDDKVLVILDGHRSHISVGLVEWARENNIIMFILPAHTSHLLQPLDVSCYGPFEKMYNNLCHKVIRQTAAAITKYNVCKIACQVYFKALSAENLVSAFRKTGIYPLNMGAIPQEQMIPAEVYDSDDSDATVEGGKTVVAEEEVDMAIFDERVHELKKAKTKSQVKQRRTVSKIIAGKEVTKDDVYECLKEYQGAKPETKCCVKGKKEKESMLKKKQVQSKKVNTNEPKAGPSHINLIHETESDSSIESDDEELCCICNRRMPKELATCVSLVFAKWAQCDSLKNGKPCKHWTHLEYCSKIRVVRRGDSFLCPHCEKSEE